jgi:hypothetical protein
VAAGDGQGSSSGLPGWIWAAPVLLVVIAVVALRGFAAGRRERTPEG